MISLTALFILLFGLFIASYRMFRRGLRSGSFRDLNHPSIEISFQGPLTLNRAYTQVSSASGNSSPKLFSTWVTRIFAAIVLQCAAIYLISQFPGFQSPFWLGIVLQAYTYGSAYIFYVSGWDDQSDQ